MKIEFCNEVPQKKRKPIEGENIKLIERLIKKQEKCMKITFRSCTDATTKANSFRSLVRLKNYPVKVVKRANEIYLIKEERND
ncbi:hypothetical protein OBO34_07315 [Clostridiales Family XIII bacterium ASD5510]|uniref:Uncharacterized protein n=1 Tax=Hominibacterium faecale TaxID=2839743 RepID=A0A9J6QQ81_9FIRM|nr:hypothetical protein [Hominibacterium faecale]MCU7378162.1 hypothetical protein [Hominibacterium faecale]